MFLTRAILYLNNNLMKYFFAFLLAVYLPFLSPHAHASAVAGALEPTQLLNLAELIPTDISTAATALNTQLLQYKITILDPLGDVLIAVAQLQTSNGIINLINGGFQGSSLIIGDPRAYVGQQGLAAVKIGLGAIASQNGPYSDTLLSSITNNFKSFSLTSKLQSINQSAIPSIIQKNACDDATLSELAKEDVAVEGQPLDQAAYTARKQYFYDQFCKGDASNPTTATALQRLQAARPSIGGWDSWLALTVGGDNEYTKNIQGNQAVAEEERAREEAAQQDYINGRGLISQKKCLVRAPTDGEGGAYANPEDAPCISDVVLNPSGLLQDSLTKAENAGLDRLGNVQGWGALVQALTKITGLVNGARSSGGSASPTNTPTSNPVTTAATNDLANDPTTRATIVDPMNRLLDTAQQTLTELQSVDQQLLGQINLYGARLSDVKACYDEVSPNDGSFLAFYEDRSNILSELQTKVDSDTAGITAARDAIQALRNVLQTSQSSDQIQAAFFTYQNTAASLPDYTILAQRKADYATYKSKATADMGSSGQLTQFENRCESMRASAQ